MTTFKEVFPDLPQEDYHGVYKPFVWFDLEQDAGAFPCESCGRKTRWRLYVTENDRRICCGPECMEVLYGGTESSAPESTPVLEGAAETDGTAEVRGQADAVLEPVDSEPVPDLPRPTEISEDPSSGNDGVRLAEYRAA